MISDKKLKFQSDGKKMNAVFQKLVEMESLEELLKT